MHRVITLSRYKSAYELTQNPHIKNLNKIYTHYTNIQKNWYKLWSIM